MSLEMTQFSSALLSSNRSEVHRQKKSGSEHTKAFLSSLDLSYRLLRYVDTRLCLVDPNWLTEPCFANFLHPDFYGNPIVLGTEPDQEFLGFLIEFEPFEPFALRYSPSRDFNQVIFK